MCGFFATPASLLCNQGLYYTLLRTKNSINSVLCIVIILLIVINNIYRRKEKKIKFIYTNKKKKKVYIKGI